MTHHDHCKHRGRCDRVEGDDCFEPETGRQLTIHREPHCVGGDMCMVPLVVDVQGWANEYGEGRVEATFEGEPIELTEDEITEAQVALMSR
jgi:hypothetical protein